jgi:hypothetical protein
LTTLACKALALWYVESYTLFQGKKKSKTHSDSMKSHSHPSNPPQNTVPTHSCETLALKRLFVHLPHIYERLLYAENRKYPKMKNRHNSEEPHIYPITSRVNIK